MTKKRFLAVVLTLALLLCMLPVGVLAAEPVAFFAVKSATTYDAGDNVRDEWEYNNNRNNATTLFHDDTVEGYVNGSSDVDYFRLRLSALSDILFEAVALSNGLTLTLLDEYGNTIVVFEENNYYDGIYYNGFVGYLTPGVYYVVVENTNNYNTKNDYLLYYTCENHVHDYTTVVTPPSCTAQGYTTYTCDCEYSYNANYTAATGHDYDDGTITIPPTETDNGECTYVCGNCGTAYTVLIPGIDPRNPFTDVFMKTYYYDSVLWAVENGITTGRTETTFVPNGSCTRGNIVTFLWRAAGCPDPVSTEHPFTDISETDYYYKAVLWAVENGITLGYTATTFEPNRTCTRGQIVTFLWRFADSPAPTSAENRFIDVPDSAYYYNAVNWAVENGIANGYENNTFQPNRTCTRGHGVTFLYRYFVTE